MPEEGSRQNSLDEAEHAAEAAEVVVATVSLHSMEARTITDDPRVGEEATAGRVTSAWRGHCPEAATTINNNRTTTTAAGTPRFRMRTVKWPPDTAASRESGATPEAARRPRDQEVTSKVSSLEAEALEEEAKEDSTEVSEEDFEEASEAAEVEEAIKEETEDNARDVWETMKPATVSPTP